MTKNKNSDDYILVQECLDGNIEEYGVLYTKYFKQIYDFIYYRIRDMSVTEDLTSEVFIRGLNKINTFDIEKGSFKNWIYGIANNLTKNYLNRNKKHINIDKILNIYGENRVDEDVDKKIKMEKIRKIMTKLKPDQKSLLIMKLWDELTYKEISQITNKSVGSLKMMFCRTINQMKTYIDAVIIFILLIIKI